MFRKLILSTLTCYMFVLPLTSHATSSGKITFSGTLIQEPCQVSVTEINVPFGNVTTDGLTTKGGTSMWTPFAVKLEHCVIDGTGIKSANVVFQGDTVGDVDAGTGLGQYLKVAEPELNQEIGIKISYPDKTLIPINSIPKNDDSHNVVFNGGKGTYYLNYGAQIISLNGPINALGAFSAIANFTVQYY